MKDAALNYGSQRFSYSSRDERPVIIHVKTKSPDSKKAEIDLNRITVEATPTNPSKPNGETKVKITFYAKDDLSGVGTISYRLRSPQGKETFTYLQHSNTYTTYFKGQANEWKKYTDTYILPKGSEPGTWGLASMKLVDKAGNIVNYDFKEVMHFVVKKN